MGLNTKFKKPDVIILSLAHLAHDTFSSFLAPLLPLLIAKLGMSLSMSALLDVSRRIPALFNPFLGLLAEKTGVKYFVILTPAITAISMGLVGLANSFAVLFILLFVAGISAALFHVPTPVIVKEASGDKVGTGMSFFMVGGELARTLGPLLVISAVSLWGLEGIYRLIPLGVIASLVLYIKLKDLDVNRRVQKAKEKGDTRKLLRLYWPLFSVIAGFLCFQSAMKSALTLYLPVYLTHQGASLWFAGISLSVLQFFGVIGTFCAGNISDKIGRQNTLVISSIGSVIAMAMFILTQNIILLAILGFFLFASGPVLMACIQDTNSNMPTFMNSMYMFINFGVSSLLVFTLGFLGDWIGLERTYELSVMFAIGTIPLAFLLTRCIGETESQ
ncbi:MFS transporter [Geopsychrobacter electrodiphilus]|uniref:MFS transporter n=1 Tax=Geopsychrobacter electrodiphilus TaxID=225196 RepID=UPI000380EFAC|nr:MFS transporter [Geopsychrobacter electrodiphilus]